MGSSRRAVSKYCAGLGQASLLLDQPADGVVRLGTIGIEFEHPLVDGDGVREPLHLDIGVGEELEELVRLGLQLASPQQPGQRLVVATLLLQDRAQVGLSLGQLGLESERLEVAGAGFGELSQGAVGIAQIVVRLGQVRLQDNGFLAVRQGFLRAAEVEEELAQVGVGHCQLGIELDRLAEMFQRLLGFSQRPQGVAQVGVSLSIVGPQLDGSLEMVDGLLVSTQCAEGQPQVVVGVGKVWPELEGRLARAHGPVELAQGPIGLCEVGMIGRQAGTQGDGAVDQLHGFGGLALLMMDHSQQVVGFGLLGITRRDRLIKTRRGRQISRLMKAERLGQFVLHEQSSVEEPLRTSVDNQMDATQIAMVAAASGQAFGKSQTRL